MSLPLRLTIKFLLNCILVWALATYLDQYFQLTGSFPANVIVVGALLTLMNMFVRPILELIMFPFKLFATIIAIIGVNGGFVQLIHMMTLEMRPDLVKLEIFGGLWGWIVVALLLGIANWVMKEVIPKKK